MAKNTRSVARLLRRLSALAAPHRRLLVGAGILLTIALVLDLLAPLLLKQLIDGILVGGGIGQLDRMIALFALIYLVKFVVELVGSKAKVRFNEQVILDARSRLYDRLQRLGLPFFHENRTGYLTGRFLSDTTLMAGLLGDAILGGLINALLLLGALAITFYLNWQLTLVLLVVVPVLAWGTRWFSLRIRGATADMQEQISGLCGRLQENLSGISVIQSYTMEDYASGRIDDNLRRLRSMNLRLADLGVYQRTGTVLMTSIAGLSILAFGGRELARGGMSIGELMAFLAYAVNVYRPIQGLLQLNVSVQKSLVAMQRYFELLDSPPSVVDRPGLVAPASPLRGAIAFRNVDFAYADGRRVLHEVSLEVPAGERVAVVGRSGAGKSTLLNLLPRFYQPGAGSIEIDGRDLRDLPLDYLRRQIGVVSQDTFLFDDTIRGNLLCCRPGASEAELQRALENANLADFVASLPHGLDTPVGERGVRISGGERQRLSIARALLKDPPILILDEATSSVDSLSERQIKEALARLLTGRTSFVIAHRFATILDADRILVLDEGRLVAQGRHEELYGTQPIYRQLYDEQYAVDDGPRRLPAESEEYLVREGRRQSRVFVRTDSSGYRRVEVTPVVG